MTFIRPVCLGLRSHEAVAKAAGGFGFPEIGKHREERGRVLDYYPSAADRPRSWDQSAAELSSNVGKGEASRISSPAKANPSPWTAMTFQRLPYPTLVAANGLDA